jgi:hypothetical protein
MTDLLHAAFAVLGTSPTTRELELVARGLREAGDGRVLDLFRRFGAEVDGEAGYSPAKDELYAIAQAAGADPFTALDLATEMLNPGWRRESRLQDVLRVRDVRDT